MARKQPSAKAADRVAERPVKLSLTLSADLAKRFGVHAEMEGLSKSELFAELVRSGCRRWVVSDRSAKPGELPAEAIEPAA